MKGKFVPVPRAEAHEPTIVVRGAIYQKVFTSEAAFEDWLKYECARRSNWEHSGGTPYSTCLVYYPDGTVSQRATAHRISHTTE